MIRFAILGNCQAATVAQCVRFLVPGCEADTYIIGATSNPAAEFSRVAERLTSYDWVLAHTRLRETLSKLTPTVGKVNRVIYYPSVEFAAYHPDMCVHPSHRYSSPFHPEVAHRRLPLCACFLVL